MNAPRTSIDSRLRRARRAGRIALAIHQAAQEVIDAAGRVEATGDDLRPLLVALTELLTSLDGSVSNPSLEDKLHRLHELVADVYDVPRARIGLAGSSGLNTIIHGWVVPKLLPQGRRRVLVDRDGHISVLGGLAISGLQVQWLYRQYDARHDTQRPIAPEDVATALDHDPEIGAVCITSPTYEGADAPIEDIAAICHSHKIPLVVDGAWGPGYGVLAEAGFPASAVSRGADLAIISLHKKGFAPAPISAVLFAHEDYARYYDIAANFGFQTTSPNFVLLSMTEYLLLELAQGRLTNEWKSTCHAADEFRNRVHEAHPLCRPVRFSDLGAASGDPGHVLVHVGDAGVIGFDVRNALNEREVDPEKATRDTLLFLYGPAEVDEVDRRIVDLKAAIDHCLLQTGGTHTNQLELTIPHTKEPAVLSIRGAALARTEQIPLMNSEGRIAAQVAAPYPPGTALFVPGERITRNHIEYVQTIWAHRGHVKGFDTQTEFAKVEVVVE